MPVYTNLADIARSAGLKVVETTGWKTRGHGQMDGVKTIVCHHTASRRNTGTSPSLRTVMYGRSDLSGPLCHYLLGRDGTVYVVASGLAYHAGQVRDVDYANAFSIGIEAENDGLGEPWPAVQVDAYARLCAQLVIAFRLSVGDVLGHKEVCYPPGRKIDPSLDMDVLRRKVTQYVNAFRSPAHVGGNTQHAPAVTLHRVLQYRPLRNLRGEDVRAVQRKIGAVPDGVFGRQTKAKLIVFQKAHRLVPDGVVGANTAHALGFGWQPN